MAVNLSENEQSDTYLRVFQSQKWEKSETSNIPKNRLQQRVTGVDPDTHAKFGINWVILLRRTDAN